MANGQGLYPPGQPAPAPAQPQPTTPAPAPPGVSSQNQSNQPSGHLPQYHLPDESAVAQAYQQHRQEAATWGRGDGPVYVKWPGPSGQTRWDASVPAGYESSIYVHILPPWAAGKGIFQPVRSHFWKSMNNPGGTSIGCPGSDQCLICQAKEAAMHHSDPQIVERAKQFGRVRTQFLYNVVRLDDPNSHYGQDGLMRPHILGAGSLLHKAIGDIIEDKQGAINVVDPMRGRPVRLKKRKTGPQMMDVEYSAISQDPQPLDPGFYPCLQNIWDLDKQVRIPDMDAMMKAVQDMGLPMPGQVSVSAPASPSSAPFQNPYGQPPGQVGQSQAPVFMPAPADPYEFPPRDAAPAQQSGWQQPALGIPAPAPAASPAMAPPPVTSGPAAPTPYQPQPGHAPAPPPPGQAPALVPTNTPASASGIPPAPAVTAPQGAQPTAQPAAQPTRQPVAAAPAAPATKPPCFGKHNPQDRTCQVCPDQLKNECLAQPAQDLNQLQSQLAGQK